MLGYRVQICRLYGFDIYIDLSWIFLSVLIMWTLATKYFPKIVPNVEIQFYWPMAIAGLIGLCFSILMHEIAHALIAKYFRMRVGAITLWIFGGVADLSEETDNPHHEGTMAIAGPVMSVVLGGVFYVLFLGLDVATTSDWLLAASAVSFYLTQANLALAIFNMIPAFPLDGGRVLRASLWAWKKDRLWATRMAGHTGTGLAFLLSMIGLFQIFHDNLVSGIWYMMIGVFVTTAAGNTVRDAISYSLFVGNPVSRYMRQDIISVSSNTPIDVLVDDFFYRYYLQTLPVVENSRLVGFVTTESIKTCDKRQWPWKSVSDYLTPLNPDHVINPKADAADALELMRRSGQSSLIVADDDRLVGLVWLKDLLRLASMKTRLEAKTS